MTKRLVGWIRRRWLPLALAGVIVIGLLGFLASWYLRVDWGSPTRRVASPTGEYEVVQYEWTAVIDPAWNLAIERVDGDGREWFWRSVEGPAPETIRFVGPTSIEVVDQSGAVYRVDFDPNTLEPTERYCLNPGYCYANPWDNYTRDSA